LLVAALVTTYRATSCICWRLQGRKGRECWWAARSSKAEQRGNCTLRLKKNSRCRHPCFLLRLLPWSCRRPAHTK